MREYEVMLILPAEADEALVGTAIGRIEKVVSADGGQIGQIDRWGRRRFAYELADRHEGYYVVAAFTAEPRVQTQLERALVLADEVLRHKVTLRPDTPKPKEQPAASPAPAATTV